MRSRWRFYGWAILLLAGLRLLSQLARHADLYNMLYENGNQWSLQLSRLLIGLLVVVPDLLWLGALFVLWKLVKSTPARPFMIALVVGLAAGTVLVNAASLVYLNPNLPNWLYVATSNSTSLGLLVLAATLLLLAFAINKSGLFTLPVEKSASVWGWAAVITAVASASLSRLPSSSFVQSSRVFVRYLSNYAVPLAGVVFLVLVGLFFLQAQSNPDTQPRAEA